MDISFTLCIVLALLIIQGSKTVAICEPRRKEFVLEFTNKSLVGPVLGSFVAMDEINCQYSCHIYDFCDMYNFNTKTDQCELLDGRSSSFKAESRKEWILRAQKCDSEPCQNGGSCYYTSSGSKCLCIRDWTGVMCNVTAGNPAEVVFFPAVSLNDKVVSINPFPAHLSKLTVSMWTQIDQANDGRKHTTLSYATASQKNAVTVFLLKSVTYIYINERGSGFFSPGQTITDSDWHHFLITWESTTGKLALYIDGDKKGVNSSVSTGVPIPAGGALVLGQLQLGYLRGYEISQAYKGNLTSLNMWDRVLTASEISHLASKCPTQEGNIVQWSQLRDLASSANFTFFSSSCS